MHGQLMVAAILLTTQGLSASRLRRASPGEKLGNNNKHFVNATANQTFSHKGEVLGGNLGNCQVYAPAAKPVGSLILLMGVWGDHSWTMSQWWYLDTAWNSENQQWCCEDPSAWNCTCWFDDNDKAAVQRLRSNLRIVDCVGKISYGEGGSAWYNYQSWPDGPPVAAEYEAAIATVFQVVEHEYNLVGGYERIAIAGMSQGADLALSVGVRCPHQLGMVISQRGMLHAQPGGLVNLKNPGIPYILTGGDTDELVPLAMFKASCASLRSSTQTPAVYLKTHTCYPGGWGCHGSFSKTEWKLLVNAFSLMLYPVHHRQWEDQIGRLTFWTPC